MSDFHHVIAEFLKNNLEQLLQAFILGITGMTIGVAKLLASDEEKTKRKVLANLILSGGLGMCAAAVLAFVPALPFVAQMGFAAVFSNMGMMGIQMVMEKVTGAKLPALAPDAASPDEKPKDKV
jgi:hypothetical protein